MLNFINLILLIPIFFIINASMLYLWFSIYVRSRTTISLIAQKNYILFVLVLTLYMVINSPSVNFITLDNYILVTTQLITYQVATLLLTIALFFTTLKKTEVSTEINISVELNFIRLIILISLLVLIISHNLILIFFFLEVYSLSAYVMVSYLGRQSVFSSESGQKYFLIGTVFSLLMVYGIALLYNGYGTLNISELAMLVTYSDTITLAGCAFFIVGLLFKLSAFPFHFWAPDVYEGSPLNVMYFLSLIPKPALFIILINIYSILLTPTLIFLLVVSCIGSIIIGSIGGVYQKRLPRLLAYSSINNVGYILLSVLALKLNSFPITTFFLIIYLFTSTGIFSLLLLNQKINSLSIVKNISNLTGQFFTQKMKSLSIALLLFSSAGLPPLVGFMSKFLVLVAPFFLSLKLILVVALCTSSLSVFYYIRVLKVMAFGKTRYYIFYKHIPLSNAVIISLILQFIVLTLLCSSTILNLLILI